MCVYHTLIPLHLWTCVSTIHWYHCIPGHVCLPYTDTIAYLDMCVYHTLIPLHLWACVSTLHWYHCISGHVCLPYTDTIASLDMCVYHTLIPLHLWTCVSTIHWYHCISGHVCLPYTDTIASLNTIPSFVNASLGLNHKYLACVYNTKCRLDVTRWMIPDVFIVPITTAKCSQMQERRL